MTETICFHNPNEENGYLSNWYPSAFIVDGKKFSSAEQYMMYRKAKCFKDEEITEKIMETDDVAIIKALGRKVRDYDDEVWSKIRGQEVYEGLLAKFSQNEDLKKRLLDTGDATLVECAVKDCIWGIGLSMDDPGRLDESKWRGKNLLGETLMRVRKTLSLKEKKQD